MKVIEIAQEIFTSSLNSPTDIGPGNISYWLRENIGQLNNLLKLNLTIGTDAQLSQNLAESEKAIYKMLYLDSYYSFQIRNNLGASAISSVLQVDDFGTSVRLQNKNELAKTWMQLKKTNKEQLDEQVKSYLYNQFKPLSVDGDDQFVSHNGGLRNNLVYDGTQELYNNLP